MNSLTVITTDRTGLIAGLTDLLASDGINVIAVDGRVIGTKAVLHIAVDGMSSAMAILTQAGFDVMSDAVLTVHVEDVSGALARLSRKLADAHIDIRMLRTISRQGGNCIVTIATNDDARARALLASQVV